MIDNLDVIAGAVVTLLSITYSVVMRYKNGGLSAALSEANSQKSEILSEAQKIANYFDPNNNETDIKTSYVAVADSAKKMSLTTFNFITQDMSKTDIEKTIAVVSEMELTDNPAYTIDVSDRIISIINGLPENIEYKKKLVVKISDSVRNFLLKGLNSNDQEKCIAQITEAEAAGNSKYTVLYSEGGYKIENGQIVGSWKI